MSLIRDAEIENTIHEFAAPLLRAADLDPKALKVHLVNDPSLNAFVTHGMNLFLHTGLLTSADDPTQVLGVMAHEFGHIAGGHVALRSEQLSRTQENLWLSYLLGAAAALATGQGEAFSGITYATQANMLEGLMAFSRAEEKQADLAGTEFMDAAGISSEGMLKFMKKLEGQELLVTDRQDPYLRSHPLTRDRIAFMHQHVETSPYTHKTVSPEWEERFKRMQAKLRGFLDNPGRTLQMYPETNTAPEALYARAIALFRQGYAKKAIPVLDQLLATAPKDPYYLELKGQILFESGDADASIMPYRHSIQHAPNDAPLYLGMARALIARGEDADYREAEDALTVALRLEPENASYWKQLAIAQGRQAKTADAAYAMAEYTIRTRQYAKAKFHAGKAAKELPKTSPKHLRAKDIADQAQHYLELEAKKRRNQ